MLTNGQHETMRRQAPHIVTRRALQAARQARRAARAARQARRHKSRALMLAW